ncbi:NADH-quinone oxidoreductase subunit N [Sphingobacterium psychroaquaticum]|nr:NADH-quinone oxidoreductase subunit N [Sphingobacterium psychroaquaticum]
MVAFVCCIFASLFIQKYWKNITFWISIIGFAAAFTFLLPQLNTPSTSFFEMLVIDNMSIYARMLILVGTSCTAIFIQQRHPKHNGDIFSILIGATIGMHLLAVTTNWLVAFIAIEMVSICSYILVGYFAQNKVQSEATMKYALFGSVCAAVMLYGLSLIYGLTGNLDFTSAQHIRGLIEAPEVIIIIALLFVFVGIGFKLSFAPFHVWSPDVYQGAPTAITAFISTVPKIGAIILFARLYKAWAGTGFYFSDLMIWFMAIAAIATMLIGNLAALRQTDLKRMMAYSAIGHTGFLLMAIFAYQEHTDYLLFYLVAYTVMNFATFLFIDQIEQRTLSTEISSFTGLGKKLPILFTAFTITLVSLIGLPPTIGFIGKLLVFSAVFSDYQQNEEIAVLILLIVGALTSVISLFYYFKIPLYAFLRESQQEISYNEQRSLILFVLALILVGIILLLGLFPSLLLNALK